MYHEEFSVNVCPVFCVALLFDLGIVIQRAYGCAFDSRVSMPMCVCFRFGAWSFCWQYAPATPTTSTPCLPTRASHGRARLWEHTVCSTGRTGMRELSACHCARGIYSFFFHRFIFFGAAFEGHGYSQPVNQQGHRPKLDMQLSPMQVAGVAGSSNLINIE